MPQVEQVRQRSLKPAITAAVALLVVVAAVVALVFVLKPKDTQQQTKLALNSASDKSFEGDHDAAIATLKAQLDKAATDEEKVQLYISLGAEYENKADNKTALDYYRQAEGVLPGYGVNEAIARTAEASGDKAMALDYLQRNRQLIKDGKAPHRAGDLDDIEAKIKELGGSL